MNTIIGKNNVNEQTTANVATATPAPVAEQKEQQTAQTSRRRRSTTPPMWRVMTQARPVFDVQLKKDNEIKLACIDKFMNAAYSDANKFWADFMEQVNILLDSRRYCRECTILGLKPEYVAEHIVFLGSATMKKVLKDGVSRTLGADVQLYGFRQNRKGAAYQPRSGPLQVVHPTGSQRKHPSQQPCSGIFECVSGRSGE